MTLVINILGGPGVGKSTVAAGVFYQLKNLGVNCELVNEYAKELTWALRQAELDDQLYIFAKQYHKLWSVSKHVDVIITDTSLLLSSIYNPKPGGLLDSLIEDYFEHFENWIYLVKRSKPYSKIGRNQTEQEAVEIDNQISKYLGANYGHITVNNDVAVETIVKDFSTYKKRVDN